MGFTPEEVVLLRRLRCAVATLKKGLVSTDIDHAVDLKMCNTWLLDLDKFLLHPPFCVNVSYPGLYRMLSRDLGNKHAICCSAAARTAMNPGGARKRWDVVACMCLELHAAIQSEV